MEKNYKILKEVTQTELFCDTCKEKIIEYGRNWYVLQYCEGAWKDNAEELTENHFCCENCLKKYLEK